MLLQVPLVTLNHLVSLTLMILRRLTSFSLETAPAGSLSPGGDVTVYIYDIS